MKGVMQLPLYEPIYINGQMTQTWAMFFQNLVNISNQIKNQNLADLIKLANQLPDQSKQGQSALDFDNLSQLTARIAVHIHDESVVSPVSQGCDYPNNDFMPHQAVFLCQDFSVDIVQTYPEVITP